MLYPPDTMHKVVAPPVRGLFDVEYAGRPLMSFQCFELLECCVSPTSEGIAGEAPKQAWSSSWHDFIEHVLAVLRMVPKDGLFALLLGRESATLRLSQRMAVWIGLLIHGISLAAPAVRLRCWCWC